MSQSERSVAKHGLKGSPPPLPPPPPSPPPLPPLPKLSAYSHQKLFKKCKSATFQLDGATYTIGNCQAIQIYFVSMKILFFKSIGN